MDQRLSKLLNDLSSTLDEERQSRVDSLYRRALDWEPVTRPPIVATFPMPSNMEYLPYPHREVLDDPEKMLFNELVHAFETSIALSDRLHDDLPLTVRSDFGTVLVASMFGAPVELRGDDPPWVEHDAENGLSSEQLADRDPMNFSQGWIPRAAKFHQVYLEILDQFPELKAKIRIVLPALQSPLDNLVLACGSEVFLEMASTPEVADRAMHTLATAQIELTKYFSQWTTEPLEGYCHQHAVMLKGQVLLRDDSSIMVSSTMYREQIAPHDERVLSELGGGGIHCCGNVAHLVDEWLSLPSIRSLDLGQSELNDVDAIYTKAAERKVPLIRLAVNEADIQSGNAWSRFPTGAVLVYRANDFETARRVIQEGCR